MKLKETEVEAGYLYSTSANQYRAVLAMKEGFMIYAPSIEGSLYLLNNRCVTKEVVGGYTTAFNGRVRTVTIVGVVVELCLCSQAI